MGNLWLKKRYDNKKFFHPSLLLRFWYPGWVQNQGTGSGINIPVPQHCRVHTLSSVPHASQLNYIKYLFSDAFKSRKPRSKSSSRLRSLKRLDGPRGPVASRSPSVKSRTGSGATSGTAAATSGIAAAASGFVSGRSAEATAAEHCNSD